MDWRLDLCYWLLEGGGGGGGGGGAGLLFYKFFCGVGGWGWLALEFLGDKFYLIFILLSF